MKRILAAAALAVGLVAGVTTSAQAVTIPRVSGTYSVKSTITAHSSSPSDVGTVATKTWKFTPSCASGGCATTLVRPRNSGHPTSVTTLLNPVAGAPMKFAGTKGYTSACFLTSGAVIDGAYTTTEKTNLTVTATNASNVATKIKGTLDLVFVPTAIGTSHNCGRDHVALSYVSLSKLS